MNKFIIDGMNFSTLDEFYREISSVLIRGFKWGENLDAFNDILRGGFGTPAEGFIIVWNNSGISKQRLGEEMFNILVEIIKRHCVGGDEEDSGVQLVLN